MFPKPKAVINRACMEAGYDAAAAVAAEFQAI